MTKGKLAWAITSLAIIGLAACGGDVIGGGGSGITGQNGNGGAGGAGGTTPPPASANKGYAPDDPVCPSSKAPALFNNAVCVCDGIRDAGAIIVRRGVKDKVAPFASNGFVRLAAHCSVDGSMIAKGGMHAAVNIDIGGTLYSEGNVDWAGRMVIGQDLATAGNIHGIGFLDVGGVMRVRGRATVLGIKKVKAEGAFQPRPGDPCNCSGVDVAGEVRKAATQNVNSKYGLSTDVRRSLGVDRVTLKSGKYYFRGSTSIGLQKLTIDGVVAIYIEGNLNAIGVDKIQLTPGSSLDLYVSGNVRTVGYTNFGKGADPAAFRLFIGGNGPLNISVGLQRFNGTIYAPRAHLTYVGHTVLEGAILAKSLTSVGLFEVRYVRPTLAPTKKCGPPSKPAPSAPPPPAPENPDKDLPRVM